MKKITAVSACVMFALAITSCGSEKTKEKEVIVVPTQTKTVVVEKQPAPKNTVISLDRNGVSVENKKVGVTIKH